MSTTRRILTSAALATLGAGLVGVLRQRRESILVRRGELTPASAAADLPPARDLGRLGTRLSDWAPQRPATRIGRVAAAAWASPLTVLGLALATTAGRRPRWDPTHACLVVDGMRGPSALALRLVGADANTIGQIVLARSQPAAPVLLAHEAVHVRQTERLGPLLFPTYVWLAARYGYRDHPLERSARAGARRAIAAP